MQWRYATVQKRRKTPNNESNSILQNFPSNNLYMSVEDGTGEGLFTRCLELRHQLPRRNTHVRAVSSITTRFLSKVRILGNP